MKCPKCKREKGNSITCMPIKAEKKSRIQAMLLPSIALVVSIIALIMSITRVL